MNLESQNGNSVIGRWWWLTVVLGIALILSSKRLHAQTDPGDNLSPSSTASILDEDKETAARDMLSLSLRLDAGFTAGAPDVQGFSLPSLRFSAFGDVTDVLSYRVSFGQTREFSSVQLPQLLPVEGYLNFRISRNEDTRSAPALNWRFGMFTPTFNPWWTPDLTDLELPDYGLVQKATFLSRDIGTELSYEFGPKLPTIGVGAFNGNGIFALNSNNSKAFTAFIDQKIGVGNLTLDMGASAYALFQSSPGAVNYVQNTLGDVYMGVTLSHPDINLMVDGFTGTFDNSYNDFDSTGAGITAILGVTHWAKAFIRWESLDHSPLSEFGLSLHHFEIGPILILDAALKAYTYYEFLDFGDGTSENAFQLRFRLLI